MTSIKIQSGFLFVILFFSGFAGLGYEMVWTRMLAVGLGHEIVAVLAVVAAFFSGMSLGAWLLDGVVSRSARPGRWYGILEFGIGLWSLTLIVLIPTSNRLATVLIGTDPSLLHHWLIAFIFPFFLLLPATFAMGATLPAMERLFARSQQNGWSVGGLYAANTFGAVAGTLLTTFFIAPAIGFRATALSLALINFFCAFVVFFGPAKHEEQRPPVITKIQHTIHPFRLSLTLFLTGFLGIGYEILAIRVVSQVIENTVYSFAGLLSVYLIGTASGAAMYQAFTPRHHFREVLTYLLQILALFCLIGILVLQQANNIFQFLNKITGENVIGAITGEIGLAAAVFFLPTLVMGAIFSHLAQASRKTSGGVGRALSVNTIGSAIAPFSFGVLLLPFIGSKLSMLAVSIAYLFLIPSLKLRELLPAAAPLCLAVVILGNQTNFNLTALPSGTHLAKHFEGVMASVSVIEDKNRDYYLKVNNKFMMGGTTSGFSDWRQGHIPLLLHPNPQTALFLGLGTGATFAACSEHPHLKAQGIELVPEVVQSLPYFEKVTGHLEDNENLTIHIADARRFINSSAATFDVIVADLFHPARDGAGFLYTVEHFKAIQSRLNSGGLFCQWLPLYQMDLHVFRMIIRTFLQVFPEGQAYLATHSLQTPIIGLVAGAKDSLTYPSNYMDNRLSSPEFRRTLGFLRLDNTFALFGNFLADNRELKVFAGQGPVNTDDQPYVLFDAPNYAYADDEPPHVRLLTLIENVHPNPSQILDLGKTEKEKIIYERLTAYWKARNMFLHAGVGIQQSKNVEEMLKQVRAPLLSIIRQSPDFIAAYLPLLGMAKQLHKTNPDAAMRLLVELEEANPSRQDAKRLRQYLYN